MTDIVKGMARASYEAVSIKNSYAEASTATQEVCEEAMHAALLWLADNVSDEMVQAYIYCPEPMGRNVKENVRKSLVSAIRAAGGGE